MENRTAARVPTAEDYVAGSLYLVCTFGFVLAYCLCLKLFLTEPDLSNKACYRIMMHMAVADVIQVVLNGGVGGICVLVQSAEPFYLIKFLGSVLNSAWIVCSALANLLAFNRFVTVCFQGRADVIFSDRNTRLFLLACWLYGCPYWVAYMSPNISLRFFPTIYLWFYDDTQSSEAMAKVEIAQNVFNTGCMIIWYTAIVIKLKTARNSTQGGLSSKERMVIVQCFLLCLIMVVDDIQWFSFPYIFRHYKWAIFYCNMGWIWNTGLNPFIYYFFNETFRRKMNSLLGIRSASIPELLPHSQENA